MYVLVYGSLMKGYWNHDKYLRDNYLVEYVGEGILKEYEMYQVSSFPGIVQEDGAYVVGEVYKIEEEVLNSLDALEGEGFMYKRVKENILLTDGSVIKAYVYKWILSYDIKTRVHEKPWKLKTPKN